MPKDGPAIKRGLRAHIIWYVIANVGQILVWWFTTPKHFFWLSWSILGWGIGLVFHIRAAQRTLRAPAGL